MTDPKALIEWLMELKHSPFCNAFGPTPMGCSCGLDEAVQAVRDLAAEVARLNKRLETEPEWGEQADGIACRDDTIKLLDEKVARFKTLGDGLARYTQHRWPCIKGHPLGGVPDNECTCGLSDALAAWEKKDG